MTEQGAEEVKEWDDSTRIFKRHGRAPWNHLKQWHHRPWVQERGKKMKTVI
jgi:hypothetical protein